MTYKVLPFVVLAAVSTSAFGAGSSISWKKGYGSAVTAAKASNKLIMIDFYTDWCGWCKKLDSDTYPAPAVVQQSEKFIPIKLNAEKDPDGVRLAKKFGVNGYPTIVFIDSQEKLAFKVVGYEPAKDFAASMERAATIRQDLSKYKAELNSNPKSYDGLIGMATLEAARGNTDAAVGYVDQAAHVRTGTSEGRLLDAYNAVGDAYQNDNQFDKAISYFSKAIVPGFDKQSTYARISIAVCYLSSNRVAEAKPYAEAVLKVPNAPKEYTDQAQQILKVIKAQGK